MDDHGRQPRDGGRQRGAAATPATSTGSSCRTTASNGAPVTYSFTYGNVGFIALDGNDASYEISRNLDYLGSAQDRWLAAGSPRCGPTRTSTSSSSASTTACTARTSCTAPTAATGRGGSRSSTGTASTWSSTATTTATSAPTRCGPGRRSSRRRQRLDRRQQPRHDVPHRRRRRPGRLPRRRPARSPTSRSRAASGSPRPPPGRR